MTTHIPSFDLGRASNLSTLQGGSSSINLSSNNNSGIATSNNFGINYRMQWGKRISMYGSYSFGQINSTIEQNTNSTIGQSSKNESLNSIVVNYSHNFVFNFEYRIDSLNYLKLSPNFSYNGGNNRSKTILNFQTINGTQTMTGYNNSLSNSIFPTIGINVLYNHKFRKSARNFSANIINSAIENNSMQDINNSISIFVLPTQYQNTNQHINEASKDYNYSVRLTYSEPLAKHTMLDVSATQNFSYSQNKRRTFNVDSVTKTRILSNDLSNDYKNSFSNNHLSLSMRKTAKKYNYNLGISAQTVSSCGESANSVSAYKNHTRLNVFPVARFIYNFNRSKSIIINYNGTAYQPNFVQLQPVTDSSNPQNVVRGNPFLKTSTTHNINLSFNEYNFLRGTVFFSNLIVSVVKNQIVNSTALDSIGNQTNIPLNVDGVYNIISFYTYSKSYKNRRYVIMWNGRAEFNHNINILNASRNIGKNWLLNQGFVFEFNHKEIIELGLGINYSLNDIDYKSPAKANLSSLRYAHNSTYNFTQFGNINFTKCLVLKLNMDYTINAGLSSLVSRNPFIINASIEQQLFKKRNGIIRLSVFDLLKQNVTASRSIDGSAISDGLVKHITRYFMLSFSYRFQKFAAQ